MEVHEFQCKTNSHEQRERIETALTRLKAMKRNVAELRARCESLKKDREEAKNGYIVCSECGKEIEQDTEIIVKDNFGNPMNYFHKDCFESIWVSQTWRFDYSANGFLKKSEKDP